jgi:prefoldin subunit 5
MNTPRTMTMADHIAIETEESVSPIQREVSRAAADAERRKARLKSDLDEYQSRIAYLRRELTRCDQAMQECLDELAELS